MTTLHSESVQTDKSVINIEIRSVPDSHFSSFHDIATGLKIVASSPNEATILRLFDPLGYRSPFLEMTNLTEQQPVRDQIRFFGVKEIDRKIRAFARIVASKISQKKLHLHLHSALELSNEFSKFLNDLNGFGSVVVLSLADPLCSHDNELPLDANKVDVKDMDIEYLIQSVRSFMNAGDHFTAKYYLGQARKKSNTSIKHLVELECLEGACCEFLGRTLESEVHWTYAFKNGSTERRIKAAYSLAMLKIRHHHSRFQDIEAGKSILNIALEEIDSNSDFSYIDMVRLRAFNRNGYALALFKQGDIEGARSLVEAGLAALKSLDTDAAQFQSTVLIYNLFQCDLAEMKFSNAEQSILKLLRLDPLFYMYWEYAAKYYLSRGDMPAFKNACIKGIAADESHYKFYQYLGVYYYKLDDFNSAEKYFKLSIHYNYRDIASYALLGSTLTLLRRHADVQQLNLHRFKHLASPSALDLINRCHEEIHSKGVAL